MDAIEVGTSYLDSEWEPHGLACMDCLHVLREGDRYVERLYAFADNVPMVEIVCASCATAEVPEPKERPA